MTHFYLNNQLNQCLLVAINNMAAGYDNQLNNIYLLLIRIFYAKISIML